MDNLENIIKSERMDIETALNVLINSIQSKYDEFSDIDKYIIGESLSTFLSYYESEEDIIIKFNRKDE